jgi:D-3-phosphoglycerate dehydrogenase / 2-oxoglutarate reductase
MRNKRSIAPNHVKIEKRKGAIMDHWKIVFTDYYYPNNDLELDILHKLGEVEIVDCTRLIPGGVKDEDGVIAYAADADAIIVQFARISRRVISQLNRCKIVSRYAIGVDNIDTVAAKEKDIVVANVPDYCIEEVSDTAIAHIFNCVRKVTRANQLLHRGEWAYEKIKPIHRFSTYTIGLVAFGNIAQRVAEKLRPFGVTLIAFDPYFKEQEKFPWVQFTSLEELLGRSDAVSIHTPLNAQTHHMINRDKLALLKPGAILINTSRGGVVDEVALSEAIQSGRVAAAGLDVLEYPDEEYSKSVLMKSPDQVFITPHLGWYSEEAINDLQAKTAMNVYEMLKNGKPLYKVN